MWSRRRSGTEVDGGSMMEGDRGTEEWEGGL
jgi:hypothetical protein